MSEPVTIRVATDRDIAAIQHVAGVTWRATYAGHIPDADIDHFLSSAYSDRNIAAAIGRLADGYVIAERDGGVIGYAMAGLNRDGDAELFAIYVLPDQHGSGVGFALWEAARASLASRGQLRMCWWVLAANARARRFYERQGSILTEEREFQVGGTTIREARYCVAISD